MITLFDLPLEILQGILSDSILSPRDLFHFSLANQTLFQFVNDNNLPLDKSTYLNLFDYNPNSQLGIPNQGYKQTLLDILQAKHCMSLGHSLSINNSVTWLQLAATPLPLNTNTDADTLSKNSAFLSTALKYFNAVTFKKDRSNPDPVQNLISLQHAQHTSHLLTLKTADISLSVPSTTVEFSFDSNGTQLSKNSYRTTQPASEHARRQVESDYRRTVYSSKNFNSRSLFGPFMPMPGFASVEQDIQGRMNLKVDWIKVEALAYLMVKNLSALIPEWAAYTGEGPFFPTGWDSTRPRQIPLDAGRDWAGVEEFVRPAFAFYYVLIPRDRLLIPSRCYHHFRVGSERIPFSISECGTSLTGAINHLDSCVSYISKYNIKDSRAQFHNRLSPKMSRPLEMPCYSN